MNFGSYISAIVGNDLFCLFLCVFALQLLWFLLTDKTLTENGLKVVTCCQREVPFNRYLLRQLGLSDILQPAEGGFGNYLLNIAGSNGVLFFNIEN